jgi:hypothetical protein
LALCAPFLNPRRVLSIEWSGRKGPFEKIAGTFKRIQPVQRPIRTRLPAQRPHILNQNFLAHSAKLLNVLALLAYYLPALRATKVNPMIALR